MAFLELHDIAKNFGKATALHETSLDVPEGSFVGILGPSGCGKTTLLNCVAGMVMPTRGQIMLQGQEITRRPPEQRHFGVVFQSYALFPHLTVSQNVAYGLRNLPYGERILRVNELLRMVDLPGAGLAYPAELSGGQQQRVALARALAPRPRLLLLDEPLSALDAGIRVHLGEALRRLQRSIGVTTIMVTHDQREALGLADSVAVMNAGRIEQMGSPQQVYDNPQSKFVASFVGEMNVLSLPDGSEFGIRYEDVLLREATELVLSDAYTWLARVEEVHYYGSFLRVRLLLQDFSTTVHADLNLMALGTASPQELVAVTLPLERQRFWLA